MEDYSDYELIKLIREKDDKQAFQLLYDKYWDKLFAAAIIKIHDEEEVNDIVQNLFVTIWIKRKELNINNNVDAYLFRALKNRIINFYKKKYLTADKLDQFSKNSAAKTDSDAENRCTYKEVESIIAREVDSMPDKMKQVFILSRDEQLSSKRISEILSLSDQTVRNQISKAIKRIKITLEKYRAT
jgi:RNA polymerase sigma-70 factor, ECF subfamily